MNDLAFCSVAFWHNDYHDAYLQQQERLAISISEIYPDVYLQLWKDEYPPESKTFLESLYGFKPHAINALKQKGYKKIVYCDSAMIMLRPFKGSYPVIAVKDDSVLPASNAALDFFGVNRKQLETLNLVGGSFYYFDFNYPIAEMVFDLWMKAEQAGIFGTQQQESGPGLQGHRHDETCMALSLYTHKVQALTCDQLGYNMENGTMIKRHFK